jgi:uncharacterized membrane protein
VRSVVAVRQAVPVTLGVAAVAVQIAYPVVEGTTRDGATILIVLLLSGAALSHAWALHGPRAALAVLGVFAGGGLLVEVIGVATGFPFGTYAYADRLGPAVGDVPLVIPLAWSMLGYPALVVAGLITGRRWLGTAVAAVALAAWDLYLDPQMVAEGYWTWEGTGPHLIGTVPATNYLAWLGTAWLMMAALWPLARTWRRDRTATTLPVALYVWTWVGSLVAHVAFLDLPQSGLYGGVGMGLVVLLLARAVRKGTRAEGTEAEGTEAEGTREEGVAGAPTGGAVTR